MELKEFVENFAEQFDDTDPSEIHADTAFRDLEEWLAKAQYGKTITGAELKACITVEDVYNLVASK